MALKRSFLKGMGLTEEQIDSIIEAHTETTQGLQQQISQLQDKANAYDSTKAELDKLTASGGDWKAKYDELNTEYDGFKQKVEAEKLTAKKSQLLDGMLTDAGINRDSVRKLIRNSYNLDGITLDENGACADRDSLLSAIKTDYAEFISTEGNKGVPPANPPSGGSGNPLTAADIRKMSADEINKNWDSIKAVLEKK